MKNPEIPDSPRLLKAAELAELLKIKPRTIYEMVAQNRVPYRKPPGTNILRFDLDENSGMDQRQPKEMTSRIFEKLMHR
ncbi:MAG TPA: helix-turn-helix domain-containing protein [Pyrinomonadaceae bacterium]|nr:helix-turn-helix domain-containing protein [Pyrinomonadaceae bacterium]